MTQAAQRAIVAALAAHPEARGSFAVRGGLLTAALVAPHPRDTEDVDLIAMPGMTLEHGRRIVREALPGADEGEVIFAETPFPGLRFLVAIDGETVQLDVGFDDPLVPPPETREILGVPVLCPRAETLIAWKLHGLFEHHDGGWRCKDMHDLWLLLRHAGADPMWIGPAVLASFESRDAPLRVTDRLLAEVMGGSSPSRKKWKSHARHHPDREVPSDLGAVVRDVATALRPIVGPLRARQPDPPAFPLIDEAGPVLAAARSEPGIRVYPHGALRVLSYERSSGFPKVEGAVTRAEHLRRALIHECRGLTLDAEGRVISRKLHRFYGLRPGDPAPTGRLLATEKLDGTLVATVALPGGPVLHTRRGPSDLADAALSWAERADGDWRGLFREQTALGRTVILEWCAASHRIVFRHPADRLVLLAVRENAAGRYTPWDELGELARRHGIELVPDRGRVHDVEAFVREIAAAPDGEGFVLRDEHGAMYKVKTERYRLLHTVREGPDHERAALRLLLGGEREVLLDLLEDRPRTGWVEAAERALE
ncbi:MAG: nucleotidyl transferase AbiEii/AbiGii toxin family protein, partial [Myxococcales bacterium]|nr:nucleotidyl transferase AbiEii/AbiGii toxin family protein [Myxococcales bacterium]